MTGSTTEENLPTSARLTSTAAEHFCRKGYSQTTTRELAKALGIRKASLYHHISNKEDLLYAIAVASLENITAAVSEAIADVPEEDKLQALIEAHVVSALTDRDMHTVMLTEMRALSPEHHDEVVDRRDAYEALLREQIVAGQKAGRLRTDVDAKLLTLSLLNVLNWTIFWYDPAADLTPERLGKLLATVYIEGAVGR